MAWHEEALSVHHAFHQLESQGDILASSGPCYTFLKRIVEEGMAWTPRPSPVAPALRSESRREKGHSLVAESPLVFQMPTGFQLPGLMKEAECTPQVSIPNAS